LTNSIKNATIQISRKPFFMKIIRSKNIPVIPVSHGDPKEPSAVKKVLLDQKDTIKGTIRMINWATLLPHKTLSSHAHKEMKEIFIILTGKPILTVDGKKNILESGDTVIIEYGEQHEMQNSSSIPVSYIVIGVV
jgi:mannose-6-phosphate isomerase-like protein (cupin superfamily)